MAVRNIVKEGDPVLRSISRPVTQFDERLSVLIDDMIETMHRADGCGLAAPQVGILRRVVVIDVGEGPLILVNPEIIETSGEQLESEGCLSCPGQYGIVKRPALVKVRAQGRDGAYYTMVGDGLLARAFCHEIDHLDGIIFKDKVITLHKDGE